MKKQSKVIATKGALSNDLESEAVILNMTSGKYYSLVGVGKDVWNLLRVPCSAKDICEAIVKEYDIDLPTCQQDILSLLDDMLAAGLIEIVYE